MPDHNVTPALDGTHRAAALLAARYGAGAAPPGIALNATIEGLLAHRSVRAFLPDPLPPGTVETAVAAAQSAPTSSNLQTWSVLAVEEPTRKARLAALAAKQGFIGQCPTFLVWLADLSRNGRVGAAQGQALEGLDYLESFLVAALDAALAAQNAVVALESLGLGCVYVGAMRNHPEAVARELGLPPNVMAVFGLAVGHPDPAVPTAAKPRLPQAVVLHRERYDTTAEPAAVARYDEAMRAFSRGQGLGDAAWTPRMLQRLASGASLSGRDRMRAVLNALGFPLK